jgi:hypothetical protein
MLTARATPFDNVIDVTIARLRRKVDGPFPAKLAPQSFSSTFFDSVPLSNATSASAAPFSNSAATLTAL